MVERLLIDLLLQFTDAETLNSFLGDPRSVAIVVGGLISISGALLGTFLLLRGASLASDAISHTVLLGIVVAFLLMVNVFDMEADLNSPWLLIGAAAAGVATVVLTEFIARSSLVKADAALGLVFPLLFAIAVILVSRYADKVHLDADSVIVGEIGIAWANADSHCLENCDPVTITPEDPRATVQRTCTNCSPDGVSPRDPEAVFEESCANCGTYTAAEAWSVRLIDAPPEQVFWPKSITVMGLLTLLNLLFVMVFYKELKLTTFDSALGAALGFRPGLLHYTLMALVSLTAVGAFDAVGSVLVVAFFIIPPATAYLLTDRLSRMILLSPVFGVLSALTGYELAQGSFLGVVQMHDVLELLDRTIGLGGYTEWETSISVCMVLMLFFFFCAAWVASPRYGLISTLLRRAWQRQLFAVHLLLGHVANHQDTPAATRELSLATLGEHLNWNSEKTRRIVRRAQVLNWVQVNEGVVCLTEEGREHSRRFRRENLTLNHHAILVENA
jgi:manganese/zinc/iron transport system permease protein